MFCVKDPQTRNIATERAPVQHQPLGKTGGKPGGLLQITQAGSGQMTAGSKIGKTTAGVAPAGSRPLLGPGARSRCVSWTPLRLFCFSLTLSLSFRWSCFICLWLGCGRHDLCAILHFFSTSTVPFCMDHHVFCLKDESDIRLHLQWHSDCLRMLCSLISLEGIWDRLNILEWR